MSLVLSRRLFTASLVALLSPLLAAGVSRADDSVHRSILPGVAFVVTEQSSGSCFLVDAQRRLVVTNFHVIRDYTQIKIFFPQYSRGEVIRDVKHYLDRNLGIQAKVVAKDPTLDLAVLQLDRLPAQAMQLPLADSLPQPGDTLSLVGYLSGKHVPFQFYEHKVVRTGVTGLVVNTVGTLRASIIEATPHFFDGNSGGALVNEFGEVVGVVTASHNHRNIGNIISASDIRQFVKELQKPAKKVKAKA